MLHAPFTQESRSVASLDYQRCNIVLEVLQNNSDRSTAADRLRTSYLSQAHIVFATLSGAGLELLSNLEVSVRDDAAWHHVTGTLSLPACARLPYCADVDMM